MQCLLLSRLFTSHTFRIFHAHHRHRHKSADAHDYNQSNNHCHDPVAGQVQVPCIERNAIASVKAINAARMALRRTSEPRVSLDKVIETMYETGKDMNAKYRETSRGGLAIKVQCD